MEWDWEGRQSSVRSKQNAVERRTGDKLGKTGSWGVCALHWLVLGKVPGTFAVWAAKHSGSSSLRTVPQHSGIMVLAAGNTARG